MPRNRRPENRNLPPRCRWSHGQIYYQVPKGMEGHWDGFKSYPMGSKVFEAFAEYARRGCRVENITTIGSLLQRYFAEVTPAKPPQSIKSDKRCYNELLKAFNHVRLEDLTPQHVYQYIDKRSAKIAARREKSMLSHAFTKAVEWGYIQAHPFKGEVRLKGETSRTRYVEDAEIEAIMSMQPKRKRGDPLPMMQGYIKLKNLIGLRQSDMLRLKEFRGKIGDKIRVTTRKTGRTIDILVTEAVFYALNECMKARPIHIGQWLFCNRMGNAYFNDESGENPGFRSNWQRMMKRAVDEGYLAQAFPEHDLRAKTGSDAESDERASELLTHDSVQTTRRAYRRKVETIKPLR